MAPVQQMVDAGDVRLAVKTWGERVGREALVLVHGFPDTSAVWDPIAELLAERYFVVTYDVRGAGASTAPHGERGYVLARLSADVAAVIDATCDRPVHLVGHDWGSVQGWECATDEHGFGGRLRSFTSISGPPLDHLGHWMREQPRRVVAAQLVKSWYVGAFHLPGARLVWRVLGGGWPAVVERLEGAHASPGDRRRDGARGISLYRANVAPHLVRPRERTTQLPVQLVVATRDRFIDPRVLDGIERCAPRTWRREIDAGHWSVLEPAARFAGWMHEWVERVARTEPFVTSSEERGDAPSRST
jgi:pimeloyl-ACP methyl ester carboxylesterase